MLGKKLQEQYLKWYKSASTFKDLDSKTVRIDVPFLDNFSDEIVMYAIVNNDNTITITDDGWTLDNLNSLGVNINKSSTRKRIFEQKTKIYGIDVDDDELYTTVPFNKFGEGKSRLLQAILAVNDMFMLSKNNTKSLFTEEISKIFEKNGIRATENVSFSGASGMTFNFDFLISGYKEIPTRLIKTLSNPSNSMFAKGALVDIIQTRNIRPEATFYVFLNDHDSTKDSNNQKNLKQIRPEITNIFKEEKIKTVNFSEINSVLPELKK